MRWSFSKLIQPCSSKRDPHKGSGRENTRRKGLGAGGSQGRPFPGGVKASFPAPCTPARRICLLSQFPQLWPFTLPRTWIRLGAQRKPEIRRWQPSSSEQHGGSAAGGEGGWLLARELLPPTDPEQRCLTSYRPWAPSQKNVLNWAKSRTYSKAN